MENLPQVPPDFKFRILVVGRGNAGKTTILKRVCDTTDSTEIYRYDPSGIRKQIQLDPSIERGRHDIEDEITFSNCPNCVFHDSPGFEAGDQKDVKIAQDFVRRKSQERRLEDRLHAIWFCLPMDNTRPSLDYKYLEYLSPDKNVSVIVIFTKYDQFRRDVHIMLEDRNLGVDAVRLNDEVEKVFIEHYQSILSDGTPFLRLERMHKAGQRCTELLKMTADELSRNVIPPILPDVQSNNLELSINQAVKW